MAPMGWSMENTTPSAVIEPIKTWLNLTANDPIYVCDPCCGTGIALAQLVDGTRAETYGMELKIPWAREAKTRLTHVLKGDWATAHVTNAVFSGVLMNPPLPDRVGGRLDEPVLTATLEWCGVGTRLLRSRGIFVGILPQDVLASVPVAQWITARLTDIQVRRFPKGLANPLGQCVVMGIKRSDPGLQHAMAKKLVEFLTTGGPIPELEPVAQPVYELPAAKREPQFSGGLINLDDVLEVMDRAQMTPETEMPRREVMTYQRAPLPLHTGQLAVLLASGALNGLIGSGDHRHLVKGSTDKIRIESHEVDEHFKKVDKIREVFRVTIRTIDATGTLRTLQTAEANANTREEAGA